MTLKPCNVSEVGDLYKKTRNYETLMEFKESGLACAQLEKYPHKDAKSCQSTLLNSIRLFKLVGIKVRVRGQKVYLVNENLIDEG